MDDPDGEKDKDVFNKSRITSHSPKRTGSHSSRNTAKNDVPRGSGSSNPKSKDGTKDKNPKSKVVETKDDVGSSSNPKQKDKGSSTKAAARSKNTCKVCRSTKVTDAMVQCGTCLQWYHFKCVNVEDSVADREWNCSECPELNETTWAQFKTCVKCNKESAEMHMIICRICRQWYHGACEDVNNQEIGTDWMCSACVLSNPVNDEHGSPKIIHDNKPTTSPVKSKTRSMLHRPSSMSSSSSLKLTRLKLLEQESAIQSAQLKNIKERMTIIKDLENGEHEDTSIIEIDAIDDAEHDKSLSDWVDNQARFQNNEPLETDQGKELRNKVTFNQSKTLPPGEDTFNAGIQKYTEKLTDRMSSTTNRIFAKPIEETLTTNARCMPRSQTIPPTTVRQQAGYSHINIPRPSAIRPGIDGSRQASAPSTSRPPVNRSEFDISQLITRQVICRDLPEFKGNPLEWPVFISTYLDSSEKCGLTNEENLLRLKKSLRGPALESVSSLLLLPDTVPKVIDTLRLLYGRSDVIINMFIEKIRAEPPINTDSLDRLIKYALLVQNFCATVEVSGTIAHLANPLLLQEVVSKIPTHLKLDWVRFKSTCSGGDLVTFKDWLMQIATYACEVDPNIGIQAEERAPKPYRKLEKLNKGFVHYAHEKVDKGEDNLKESTKSSGRSQKFACEMCRSDNHRTEDCQKFLDLSKTKRWDVVFDKRLCRRCLKPHSERRCQSTKRCGVDGCQRRHHQLLHNPNNKTVEPSSTTKNLGATPESSLTASKGQNTKTSNVWFRILPITLHGPGGTIDTFAFFDSGSEVTLLAQNIASQLKLEGQTKPLCLKWTGETYRSEPNSKRVELQISNRLGKKKYTMSGVRTTEELTLPMQSVEADDLKKYAHLRGIPIESYDDAEPCILIGLDNWHLGVSLEVREGGEKDPVANRTRLGWVVCGLTSNIHTNEYRNFHLCECQSDESLHQMLKEFFTVENFGVMTPNKPLESNDDRRANEIIQSTVKFDGLRYEIGLLWKFENIHFPDSFQMAVRRLECLEKKMSREPGLKAHLVNLFEQYLNKGYIRKLDPNEPKTERTWYLPTFVVRNPNKPDKIRVVWDAAAVVKGVSLNTFLVKGPDLLMSLPDILGRFREKQVAICGDLREMFHQIKIRPADQQALRFLWRNGETTRNPDTYVSQVLIFGASCAPFCALFVKNLHALKNQDQFREAAAAIIDNHYVDDWLQSVDDEESAIRLAKEVRAIHASGGFEIRNWISNSSTVLQALGENTMSETKDFEHIDEPAKVLGLWWRPHSDTFSFRLNKNRLDSAIMDGSRRPTKREVLRTVMLIYDPLGLLGFFLVQGKMLLQEIWTSKVDWDEPIANGQYESWIKWIAMIPKVCDMQIPRWYSFTKENQNVQLHTFLDASDKAYAAVSYFRIESIEGVRVVLIGSKTKVAPLRPMSIPRLELQAAVLGTRFSKTIQNAHSIRIDQIYFWSDSQTVLRWLNSDHRRYKQFVALRIGEILETTEVNQWRWVPTKLNVSDEATKWRNDLEINSASRWVNGSQFIKLSSADWPPNIVDHNAVQTDNEELKVTTVHEECMKFQIVTPDVSKFSQWNTIVNIQAYVRRYVRNLRSKEKTVGPLCVKERERAQYDLFLLAQYEEYRDEILLLRDNPSCNVPKSSRLRKLSPYLDDVGLLRVRGRIDAANCVPFDTRRPIILPARHHVTLLIMRHYHDMYHHQNSETVVNEIRQRFVIRRLRAEIRKIRLECQSCKNEDAIPRAPEMGELPYARLAAFTQPFTYTGLDFFGPMHVVIGRNKEKRWGSLYTCLTTRAIHIELSESLNMTSCINCLRCFIGRRGTPIEIYTDNATNFKGANNDLSRELDKFSLDEIQEYFSNIKWNFIPPASPHMGGSWERLVRSVKTTLARVLDVRQPRLEILRTALIEVENIINSRPLTYIPVAVDEPEALTPNHFLLGSSNGAKPPGVFDDDPRTLENNWRMSQQIADIFWKRWIAEYLPELTRRTRWYEKIPPIQPGDVVVIYEDKIRNSWKKGIVVDTNKGTGDQIRSVVVKTQHGVFTRPVTKVAVLDVKK